MGQNRNGVVISMDTEKILANIAKKGNIPVADLKKELAEIQNGLPASPDRDEKALKMLNDRHSGGGDKTAKYQVVIFGIRNANDFNKKRVDDAMKQYQQNKETALNSGAVKIINGVPTVIDQEQFFNDGKTKNSNFGKPLLPSWNRNCFVFAREDGQTEWVKTTLALRNDFATEKVPEQAVVLNANLLGSIKDGLKTAKSTQFKKAEGVTVDLSKLLFAQAKDECKSLGDLLDFTKKLTKETPGYYDRFVVTSGKVKFITDATGELDKNGKPKSHNGKIDDLTVDKLVTIFVDNALPCPTQGEEYTFIGQTSLGKVQVKQGDSYVETDEDELRINVMGYFKP